MIKNFTKALLVQLLIVSHALAGLPPTTAKGQTDAAKTVTFNTQVPFSQATRINATTALLETGSGNILINPGFEGTTGWTASGGATTAINTTAVGTGANGYDWDSNATPQTLTSDAVTIPVGLRGRSGVVSCLVKTPSGAATHTLSAYDGTNTLASGAITSTTSFARTSINFIFPSSGTIALRLTSVNANEPEIYVEDCYMGPADTFNVSQVNQATLFGTMTITTCSSDFNTTNLSFTTLGTQTNCVYTATGALSQPGTNIMGFKVASLPPGEYLIVYEGYMYSTANGVGGSYRLHDGTSASREISPLYSSNFASSITGGHGFTMSFGYTTAQSNITFDTQGMSLGASGGAYIRATVASPLVIKVYRFPTSAETGYRPEQTPASWSGYHDSTCGWSTSSTTFTGSYTGDASCTLVERKNRNFGAVTTHTNVGNAMPGLVFSTPKAGRYYACANVTGTSDVNAKAALYELYDVTDSATISTSAMRASAAANTNYNTIPVCGIINIPTAGSRTIMVRLAAESGTTAYITSVSSLAQSVEWSIFSLDSPMPAPLLVGSVTSSSTGLERVERAAIANNGTCSITSQSGWLSSVTASPSSGGCTLNITTGMFSAAPTCVCIATGATGFNIEGCRQVSASTSTFIYALGSGATYQNDPVNVVCVGPR